jgi:diguanylate cyclase (GGDEF)-like protein
VRSGGEEFQIIAPHTSAIEALKMAEKVRLAIAEADIPGVDHVTVSLGVAQLGEQESGDSLVQRVNAALARAKRAGRNCVELAMQ